MIKTEIVGDFIRTWSDRNMMIRGGFPYGLYEESIDPISAHREFEETDIPIPQEEATVEEKAEAYDILIGDENDQG